MPVIGLFGGGTSRPSAAGRLGRFAAGTHPVGLVGVVSDAHLVGDVVGQRRGRAPTAPNTFKAVPTAIPGSVHPLRMRPFRRCPSCVRSSRTPPAPHHWRGRCCPVWDAAPLPDCPPCRRPPESTRHGGHAGAYRRPGTGARVGERKQFEQRQRGTVEVRIITTAGSAVAIAAWVSSSMPVTEPGRQLDAHTHHQVHQQRRKRGGVEPAERFQNQPLPISATKPAGGIRVVAVSTISAPAPVSITSRCAIPASKPAGRETPARSRSRRY